MLEIRNDIFLQPSGPEDAICITTNGMVKRDGTAVMGRGIALTAARRFPLLPRELAKLLKQYGNHAFDMGIYTDIQTGHQMRVITLPTKHNWRDNSDMNLILRSIRELVQIRDDMCVENCYLPRPGCANGHLNWPDVKHAIAPMLDDGFIICDFAV